MEFTAVTSDQQTIEQAWQALQSTPSYVERDTRHEWAITTREFRQLFPDSNICLSCGETNVDEQTHQCNGRRVA